MGLAGTGVLASNKPRALQKGLGEEGFGLIEFLVLFGSDVGPVDELFFIPVIHTVFRGLEGQQMRSISGVSPFCTF